MKHCVVDTMHISMFLNQIRDVFFNQWIFFGIISKIKTRHTSDLQ